jgi:hypothetical protein
MPPDPPRRRYHEGRLKGHANRDLSPRLATGPTVSCSVAPPSAPSPRNVSSSLVLLYRLRQRNCLRLLSARAKYSDRDARRQTWILSGDCPDSRSPIQPSCHGTAIQSPGSLPQPFRSRQLSRRVSTPVAVSNAGRYLSSQGRRRALGPERLLFPAAVDTTSLHAQSSQERGKCPGIP